MAVLPTQKELPMMHRLQKNFWLWVTCLSLNACIPQDLRSFSFEIEETVTVPGKNPLANTGLVPADVIPPDLNQVLSDGVSRELSTENVPTDALESLQFTKVMITIQDPEENGTQVRDLSFFSALAFKIGEAATLDIIAESEADAFAEGTTTYTFPQTSLELLPFFSASETLELVTVAEVGDPPNFETKVDFYFEITAVAKGF